METDLPNPLPVINVKGPSPPKLPQPKPLLFVIISWAAMLLGTMGVVKSAIAFAYYGNPDFQASAHSIMSRGSSPKAKYRSGERENVVLRSASYDEEKLIDEYVQRLQQLDSDYRPVSIILAAFRFLVASALLYNGVFLSQLRPFSREALAITLVAAIGFEAFDIIVNTSGASALLDAVEQFQKSFDAIEVPENESRSKPPDLDGVIGVLNRRMGLWYALTFAKVSFYMFSLRYVMQPKQKKWFADHAGPARHKRM